MSDLHPIIEHYQKINRFGSDNGWELRVIEPGKIEYTCEVEERHLATPFAAHGGYLSALMDAALSVAGLSKSCEDEMAVATIEFKINYLRPAFKGVKLLAIGYVVKYGKDLIFSEAEIRNEDGKVLASGQGTLTKVPASKAFGI